MAASGNWARMQRTAGGGAREPATDDAFLASLRRGAGYFDARARVKGWTRERFALDSDGAVAVSEAEGRIPGGPPLETVVEFWTADGLRHHFKVFKALAAVVEDDLPPRWLKDALAMPEGYECDCC
jgi:nitrate reductase delta subunit